MNKETKLQFYKSHLGKQIFRKTGKAMADYKMIEPDDHVIVAVSGGKDSLTMLDLIVKWRRVLKFDFKITAVNIELAFKCKEDNYSSILTEFFNKNKIDFHFIPIDVLSNLKDNQKMSCFFCARQRRIAIFKLADKIGANKVALGHHRDDIVETVLMNMFFNASFSTMVPNLSIFKGKLHIIRPLAYIEEKNIEIFTREEQLPVHNCHCPYGKTSKRAMVKDLLNNLEKQYPRIKYNIFSSMKHINSEYLA